MWPLLPSQPASGTRANWLWFSSLACWKCTTFRRGTSENCSSPLIDTCSKLGPIAPRFNQPRKPRCFSTLENRAVNQSTIKQFFFYSHTHLTGMGNPPPNKRPASIKMGEKRAREIARRETWRKTTRIPAQHTLKLKPAAELEHREWNVWRRRRRKNEWNIKE